MSIGSVIRKYRKEKKIKQKVLAEKADISATYLSDVELGRKNPSITTLGKIASALGVTKAFLMEREEAQMRKEERK